MRIKAMRKKKNARVYGFNSSVLQFMDTDFFNSI